MMIWMWPVIQTGRKMIPTETLLLLMINCSHARVPKTKETSAI